MDPRRRIGEGSADGREMQKVLRFGEICLPERERGSDAENGSTSFTALLGLPAGRAMELLREMEAGRNPMISFPAAERNRQRLLEGSSLSRLPAFPSDADLVERAARFSVFAGRQAESVKAERTDSDSDPNSPILPQQQQQQKRKAPCDKKKSKANAAAGKRPKDHGGEEEKLPYVHVRARRGQATDSHSLAERARREKINARMKLLQELVPGCSKVSGTAQVLDEIINHVQSLQRQVEFLSMRLAAVNPAGIDLGGIDGFIAANGAGGAAWMEQAAAWAEPHRQVRLADLLPKPSGQALPGKGVVFFPGNHNSAATL